MTTFQLWVHYITPLINRYIHISLIHYNNSNVPGIKRFIFLWLSQAMLPSHMLFFDFRSPLKCVVKHTQILLMHPIARDVKQLPPAYLNKLMERLVLIELTFLGNVRHEAKIDDVEGKKRTPSYNTQSFFFYFWIEVGCIFVLFSLFLFQSLLVMAKSFMCSVIHYMSAMNG